MKRTILIIFVIICLIFSIVFFLYKFTFPKSYSNYIFSYSEQYKLDPALVFSIVKAESGFNANAVSKSGAMGLMQLLPTTARWIATELGDEFENNKLFDPETNIKYGCFYLNYLKNKFNNIEVVICAYNAGESVVRNWILSNGTIENDNIEYPETKNYLRKVKFYYSIYKNSL